MTKWSKLDAAWKGVSVDTVDHDRREFWETYGYHNYGDPWKEARYQGD